MVSKTDSSGTTRYTYNTENQLIRVELPDGKVAEYKYDPFGRRIEKSVTATGTVTVTRYVYDREDILFELDANGNVVTEFVHGPGIDEPIAMIKGGQTYYYHADGLGSIVAITDSAGRVVQRYEYDSFGNIAYQQDPDFVQPYTYTGREYDQESGLYYYRARYYDAKAGRFVSQDPIGFAGGINFYSYVGNNPINLTDPFGLAYSDQPCYYDAAQGRLVCPNPGLYPPDFKKCIKCDFGAILSCIGNIPASPPLLQACNRCFSSGFMDKAACSQCGGTFGINVLDCIRKNCREGKKDECGECK